MKKNKINGVVKGALSLGVGAFAAKILGAIYRVPLTNLLGGEGLGIYQTVFPVYALLLDFSGAAVPSAISKIISSYRGEEKELNAYEYLRSSLKLLFFLGAIGTILMAIFSFPLAKLQGNTSATFAYLGLAPAIFFVCVISCFRGYYQGLMNMNPTAISQIVEQTIKLVAGLILVKLLLPNLSLAVAGATFAITISEVVASLYLLVIYHKRKKRLSLRFNFDKTLLKPRLKRIIKTTVPITLIGIMIPLSQVIDSFLVVNILSSYRADATALYGLLCGAVATVINLPVSICYGIATVAIPTVSAAKDEDRRRESAKVLLLTLLVALPCAILCAIFAPFAVNILFGGLSAGEKQLTISLLKASSPNIVLLSFLQTSNGVLIGRGDFYLPIISLTVGVAVKTVLNLILLKIPFFNIFGGVLSVIACYFVGCLLNLLMIFIKRKSHATKESESREISYSQ